MVQKKILLAILSISNAFIFTAQGPITVQGPIVDYDPKIAPCIKLSAWAEALGNSIEKNNLKYKNMEMDNDSRWNLFFENNQTPVMSFDNINPVEQENLWHSTIHPAKMLPYTDDTRMASLVTLAILTTPSNQTDYDNVLMGNIANHFLADLNSPYGWIKSFRGPGNTCQIATTTLQDSNQKSFDWWNEKKTEDKYGGGCGSVMRAYPFGLLFTRERAAELAAKHSNITHGAPMALAACAAMAAGIAEALQCKNINKDNKGNIKEITKDMYLKAEQYDHVTGSKIWDARIQAKKAIQLLTEPFQSLEDAYKDLFDKTKTKAPFVLLHKEFLANHPGWDAGSAIATVVYLFTLSQHYRPNNDNKTKDLLSIVRMGIAHPGDSDSVGSMIGALMGAFYGDIILNDTKVSQDIDHLEGFVKGHKELDLLTQFISEHRQNSENTTSLANISSMRKNLHDNTTLSPSPPLKAPSFLYKKVCLCLLGCSIVGYLLFLLSGKFK